MRLFMKNLEDKKQLYTQIAFFAMLWHIAYIVIFFVLSMNTLVIYNIFSSLFYFAMIFVVKKEFYKFSVVAVHAEVALFVIVSSFYGGMSMGMGMYLLSMASTVYFCPFNHKQIPYILTVGNGFIYIALRIYVNCFIAHGYPTLSTGASTFLHVFNAVSSFLIILLSTVLMGRLASRKQDNLKKENRKLAALANYDDLTGLQSRLFFVKRVRRLVPSSAAAIAIGDIDDFKHINDTYGHACGDYVLQSIADLIRKTLNPECTYICRWGGEEFTFLFHDTPFDDSCAALEKLRTRIENYPFLYKNSSFRVTMTFGIVPSLGKPVTLKMLDSADKLLYKGKKHGKNQVVK